MPGDKPSPEGIRLPGGVTAGLLRDVVAANRSWRGVLRQLGMTAPRNGRLMRAACDELDISYEHFSPSRWDPIDEAALATAVASSRSWSEVMVSLGFAVESGSARASLRKAALTLGLDLSHLAGQPVAEDRDPFAGPPHEVNLRHAAPLLVAAKCTLLGHRVAWPLEPQPYDLLVETRQSGVLRVQVKSSTRFAGGSWIASITRRRRPAGSGGHATYTAEQIDYFGIVDPDQRVYMLPISVVEGQTAVSLRKYAGYRVAC